MLSKARVLFADSPLPLEKRPEQLNAWGIHFAAWNYIKAELRPEQFNVKKNLVKDHLEDYYRNEGKLDEVRLTIPDSKGCVMWHKPAEVRARSDRKWPTIETPNDDAPVTMEKFKAFLEHQSEAQGTSAPERDRDLQIWATTNGFPEPAAKSLDAFFKHLDQGSETLTFTRMRDLATGLGIHAIMLDPLLSREVSEDCVVLELPSASGSEHIKKGHFGTPPPYAPAGRTLESDADDVHGSGATYAIPDRKVEGTDAAFVFLRLEPKSPQFPRGGHSTQHHHPGDELLLVLKGTVSVTFIDTGVTFELKEQSYVHFYAEQNHAVVNESSSDSAELFIIRFYQLHSKPAQRVRTKWTRQAMRHELWDWARTSRGPRAFRSKNPLTWGWLLGAVADRSVHPRKHRPDQPVKPGVPHNILNPFGLARFLDQAGPGDLKGLKKLLAELESEHNGLIENPKKHLKLPAGRDWLWLLQNNQIKVPRRLIDKLVDVYDVFDLLVCEFLFPSWPRQVVVRRTEATKDIDWVNMLSVVNETPELKKRTGVNHGASRLQSGKIVYEVPARSLFCSDVAISWLQINETKDTGLATSPNTHTGCELIVPLEGKIAIEYLEGPQPRVFTVAANTQIAHYNSNRKHILKNTGDGPAKMFLIRFYLDEKGSQTLPKRGAKKR
jgi:mannose-6-phosphate isomerase-like protein (cupin superfamily)